MKKVLFLFLVSLFASCATHKQVNIIKYSTPYNKEVIVLGLGQKAPANSELLGSLKIGDSGFTTKCDYATVINQAIEQAKSMGGSHILIIKHKNPDLWSTCHRVTCEVYLEK